MIKSSLISTFENATVNVHIRPLKPDDIGLVTRIEKEAFPTVSPPTPFKRELNNRLTKYLVACAPGESNGLVGQRRDQAQRTSSILDRLFDAVGIRGPSRGAVVDLGYSVPGFVGLWFMAGEAHITAIAVEEASRGMGIGELLLMASVELAMSCESKVVTLEVRLSNEVAQSLYQKYGFHRVGLRKAYYTDNREDAVIMTTQPLDTYPYLEKFRVLKRRYMEKHGKFLMVLE